VPNVDSAAQARDVAGACRYPPAGYRSVGGVLAAGRAVLHRDVESVAAVEELDATLKVAGVDGIYVGPRDLSYALGCELNPRDPVLRPAWSGIWAGCAAAGKPVGVHATDGATARLYLDGGCSLSRSPRTAPPSPAGPRPSSRGRAKLIAARIGVAFPQLPRESHADHGHAPGAGWVSAARRCPGRRGGPLRPCRRRLGLGVAFGAHPGQVVLDLPFGSAPRPSPAGRHELRHGGAAATPRSQDSIEIRVRRASTSSRC